MPKTKRAHIYHRDGKKCVICGKHLPFKKMTLDHIIPKSKGGSNDVTNLRSTCFKCNCEKGDSISDDPPDDRPSSIGPNFTNAHLWDWD